MSDLLRETKSVIAIGRHAHKDEATGELSAQGETQARWIGEHLPKGFSLHAFSGEKQHHRKTAEIMISAYAGEKETHVRVADEIKFERLAKASVSHREELGEEILKQAFMRGAFYSAGGKKRPLVLHVSSDYVGDTVLSALGMKMSDVKPKGLRARSPPKQGQVLQFGEALLFFTLPTGKIILAFRGRRFDVTRTMKRLLKM